MGHRRVVAAKKYGRVYIVDEKRKVERFDLNLKAYVTETDGSLPARAASLVTRDISMSGAFLITDHPLPAGAKVSVDLILSLIDLKKQGARTALIKVTGEVLRKEPEGMTICFENNSKIMPFSKDKLEFQL